MFVMEGSASLNFNTLYNAMGTGFDAANDFQKSLWWYNGAYDAGVMAMPPTMSASDLFWRHGNPMMSTLRNMFPGCERCQAEAEGGGHGARGPGGHAGPLRVREHRRLHPLQQAP